MLAKWVRFVLFAPLLVAPRINAGEGLDAAALRSTLQQKIIAGVSAARFVRVSVQVAGTRVRAAVKEADANGIRVEAGGVLSDITWADAGDAVIYAAAAQTIDEQSGDDLMLLAKFAFALGWKEKAEAAFINVEEISPFHAAEAEQYLAKLRGDEKPKVAQKPKPVAKKPPPKPATQAPPSVPPGPEKMEPLVLGGQQRDKAPDWAAAEFELFAGTEEAIGAFLDKYLEPSGAVCVHVDNAGTADDIVEGIATWDRYLVLSGSERVRNAYVSIWKNVYKELCNVGNGFRGGYYSGGYDAEHASELLQHLFGCLDVFPKDKELIEQNRKVADAIYRCIEQKTGLFRSTFLNNSGGAMGEYGQKTSGHDFVYMNPMFHEYIRTGDPKYRLAILRFGEAMNRAAERNEGIIPCMLKSDGTLFPDWWNGLFSYAEWGLPGVGNRGWHSYMCQAMFLSGGDARTVRGQRSTVRVLFEKGGGRVPALKFDGKSWVQGNNWQVMPIIERLYDLCWDEESEKWMRMFGSGYGKFFYFGSGGTGQPAATFRERATWMRQQGEKIRASNKIPKTGDELTEMSPKFYFGFHYIDGNWWAMGWDNGRCGGTVNAPARYFREDGTTGLPPGVAAVVTHVDRDWFGLQLYNDNAAAVKMWITGGFYGTHCIQAVKAGEETKPVGGPRLLIELPAKTETALEVIIQRYAYRPNAYPWEYRGVPVETLPQDVPLNRLLNVPF